MKILIVDDSKAMRRIVRRTLRQAGYDGHDVIEAEDGAAGLEAVRNEKPDLVLSDWNMPQMNGLEFLKAVRAEGFSMPFGFITTEGTDDMRAMASDAGGNFLITKPFTADDVKDTLGQHVK